MEYTGYGWESSDVLLQSYAAGESTDQQFGTNDRTLRQVIHFEQPNDLIFAAGDLLSLNTDYTIAARQARDMGLVENDAPLPVTLSQAVEYFS